MSQSNEQTPSLDESSTKLFTRVVDLLRVRNAEPVSKELESKLQQALEKLQVFFQANPESVPALRLMAEIAQCLGDTALARKNINQAEELDPWNLEILIISESLYEIEAGKGPVAGMPPRLDSKISSGVINPTKLIEKAMGAFRLGDFERAYTLAKLAYKLSPEIGHHLLDIWSIGAGFAPERTRKELILLEKEHPDQAYLFLALGSIDNVLGLYDEAVFWLDKGIQINPSDAYLLALLYNEKAYVLAKSSDQLEHCIKLARAALEIFPNKNANGFIRDTLGVIYLKKGDTEKAIRNLREAVSKDPTIVPRFHLAVALIKQRDPSAALTELKTIALESPSLESPHIEEAIILQKVQSHLTRLEDLLNLKGPDDLKDAFEILEGLI